MSPRVLLHVIMYTLAGCNPRPPSSTTTIRLTAQRNDTGTWSAKFGDYQMIIEHKHFNKPPLHEDQDGTWTLKVKHTSTLYDVDREMHYNNTPTTMQSVDNQYPQLDQLSSNNHYGQFNLSSNDEYAQIDQLSNNNENQQLGQTSTNNEYAQIDQLSNNNKNQQLGQTSTNNEYAQIDQLSSNNGNQQLGQTSTNIEYTQIDQLSSNNENQQLGQTSTNNEYAQIDQLSDNNENQQLGQTSTNNEYAQIDQLSNNNEDQQLGQTSTNNEYAQIDQMSSSSEYGQLQRFSSNNEYGQVDELSSNDGVNNGSRMEKGNVEEMTSSEEREHYLAEEERKLIMERYPRSRSLLHDRREIELESKGYRYHPEVGWVKLNTAHWQWDQARKSCEADGGNLAVPDTLFKIKTFTRILKDNVDIIERAVLKNQVFVGVYVAYNNRTFITVKGEPFKPESVSIWFPNEPNNADPGEDCVTMHLEGKLRDVPCFYNLPFLCQIH